MSTTRDIPITEAYIEEVNQRFPIGTPVFRYRLIDPLRECIPTVTRSEAWLTPSGAVLIKIKGLAGGVLLESLVIQGSNQPGICNHCGCTDSDCSQCIEKTGRPCHWANADQTVCSACKEAA